MMHSMRYPVLMLAVAVLLLAGPAAMTCGAAEEAQAAAKPAFKPCTDWKVGVQAWSFNRYSFFEAVDRVANLGMPRIEAFPGQALARGEEAKLHHTMSAEGRERVKEKLASRGVCLKSYGVVNGKDDAEWRAIFEFAKEMGIETIASEPAPEQLDAVEALADEFCIDVAFHNHPEPSRYAKPEAVLEAIEGRSARLGFCADTGHWVRSGLDPVECLKKAEGRIKTLHFKDLNASARDAHDVPWGSGTSNVWAMLSELKRQKFSGSFLVEYEHDWENSMNAIRESYEYFKVCRAAMTGCMYRPLFAEDLSNGVLADGGWAWEDGALVSQGNGDIWTAERYGDFVLDLEFQTAENTNSGVFVRTGSIDNWLHTAIEVQILQPDLEQKKHVCGAIFDVLEPMVQAVKETGEWNHYVIMVHGQWIHVTLNNQPVIAMDLNRWTEAHKNPDGTPNKFNTAYMNMPIEGHVGLQYHGHPVAFRNMKIKPLTPATGRMLRCPKCLKASCGAMACGSEAGCSGETACASVAACGSAAAACGSEVASGSAAAACATCAE